MIAFVVLMLVLIPLLVVFVYGYRKNLKYDYPVPEANPFAGHMIEVMSTTRIIKMFSKYIQENGKIVHLKFGPLFAPFIHVLLTEDYKFVEFILSSNKILTKSIAYEFFKPWLGEGLISANGDNWRKHRKIVTPAFHFEILKEFVSVFESVGDVLIKKLGEKADSPSLDLHPFVSLCALDIICETAMGTKINAQEGENSDYVESVKEMLNIVVERCLSPFKVYNLSYMFTKDSFVQRKLLKVVHKFSSDVIDKVKKENRNEIGQKGKKMAFLDLLLKYSKNGKVILNYTEIREEVDTFMLAGHETTAKGICYTLFCLADHPEIQEKVLQEQKRLFGEEKNPKITYQELQNMKYLELVIKESLRYYPVIPMIGRLITEDTEFDGKIIPKNTNIFIFLYGMLKNPDVFPEPEKFNPDRFKNWDNNLPFAYIPFSAGPRNCIGQKYAMLEMKSVISKVIRHFELVPATPKHNFIFAAEVTLNAVNGVKVGLKKRM